MFNPEERQEGNSHPHVSERDQDFIRITVGTLKKETASNDAEAELRQAFALKQVMEIAFVVATGNFIQRIGKNFDIELEQS